MGRVWRWVVATTLLVALVVWVQRTVGWPSVLAAFARLQATDIALVLALTVVGYAARALRLAAHFGPPLRGRFGRCLRVMVLHNAANNLLPMRAGELTFPLLLKREFGVETSRSIGSLLWLRVLDLLALMGVAAVTLGIDRWGPLVGLALATTILGLAWALRHLARAVPVAEGSRLAALRRGVSGSATELGWTQLWTLTHWVAKLAAYALVLWRIGELPRTVAILGAVAGELTSVLPIHGIAGAGTYEGGIVLVLRPLGVETATALTAATDLHLFLLALSILSAALALPFGRRSAGDPA